MVKSLVFTLFLGFSIFSSARVDLRKLSRIESFELIAEEGAVLAGEEFFVFLKIQMKNGAVHYSNINKGIGFNDFKVNISGAKKNEPYLNSTKITFKGETLYDSKAKKIRAYENNQLALKADFDLINQPYILIQAHLIEHPEIVCELSLPVHFSGKYNFDFSGSRGDSGFHGGTPRRSEMGNHYYDPKHFKETRDGSNGKDGLNGEPGENGMPGYDGYDMQVFVSLVDCQYENKQLVKVEVIPERGEAYTRYLEKNGKIKIKTRGGNGGNGGNGGSGADGTNGGHGKFMYHPLTGIRLCNDNGKGGDAGNGGSGGYGGNAGNGGNGGDVSVFFEKNAAFFKDRMIIENYGGKAGTHGVSGAGGCGGFGGDGGKGKGANGRRGRSGLDGNNGIDGSKGEINYFIW